jgi:3-dehydroquinate synthase
MRMSVDLGERSYPIHMETGGLERLGPVLLEVLGPTPRVVLVSNPVVAPLHGPAAEASLRGAGIELVSLQVPDGEASKGLGTWQELVLELLEAGVDRHTPVLALGGGVTGDVVGFAAATALRGLPFVQVPTTLLAMVDSAVGGKTGVNTSHGKNLVGAFHQPVLVFSAMQTLQSLPQRELRCGLGEVVKHGVLADPALLDLCVSAGPEILAGEGDVLAELVRRSCLIKAAVVSADERESGQRVVLNLGHTVGHALETVLSGTAQPLPHGECVAIGLLAEARWAVSKGACSAAVPERIATVLGVLGLPTAPPPVRMLDLVAAAGFDKKVHRGRLKTAIIEAIGRVRLTDIDAAEIPHLFHSFPGSG